MKKNKRPTQSEKVMKHLECKGHITTFEAFVLYGITRLPSRIFELREELLESGANLTITTNYITKKGDDGETITFSDYRLEKIKEVK